MEQPWDSLNQVQPHRRLENLIVGTYCVQILFQVLKIQSRVKTGMYGPFHPRTWATAGEKSHKYLVNYSYGFHFWPRWSHRDQIYPSMQNN